MSNEQPSSSAQALVAVGRDAALRGLKTSFDELDDDDHAAIGRAFTGVTARHALSALGAVVGAGAGVALAATFSVVAGGAVVCGVVGFAFFVGRRELRATLVDHGLSPALIDAVARVGAVQRWRASRRAPPPADPWRLVPRTDDYVRLGRILAEAARAEHER
jgi:hypothetical protein